MKSRSHPPSCTDRIRGLRETRHAQSAGVDAPLTLTDPTIRPRAIRLVEYLEAVRGLREQPIRDIAEYRDKRWWAADIPAHPACVVTATGEEPWLRVSKASVPPPPPVPDAVTPYLETGAVDPEREPALVDNISEIFDGGCDELEDLRGQLDAYVSGPWREWIVQALPALRARALYDDLFELRQRLQRDSAMIELVWGNGILSWMTGGVRIVHPLVTTQVQLSFDPKTGSISVVPEALLEQQHHLEIDLLQGLRLSGFDLLVDARERFREDPTGPFDPENRALYEKLLAPLGHDGQVLEAATPPPATSAPTITATWVLMVRRRATMYRRFFGDLKNALDAGQFEVPAPLVAVVADEPGKLEIENLPYGDDSWHRTAERLLMPLPTNPEQEQVATRLAQHRGVTVQGPPGTGKTHTIANLICHLIGHGKRVLVTSQKEQALSVLRDKIPESVRDLSVAVLGSSTTSLGQLELSVRAIYENAVALDRAAARQGIRALDEHLTSVQRDVGALRTRISASIARERDIFTLGTIQHSPSTLGKWLADHEGELGYIPDDIEPAFPCPLSAAEIADLFRLVREITPEDRVAARRRLPAAADLPTPAELATATTELSDVRDQLAGTEAAIQDRVSLERLTPDELGLLINWVEQAAKRLELLEQPWLAAIRGELRTSSFAALWHDQIRAIGEGIEELAAWRNRLLGHRITLPGDDIELRETALPGKELITQLTEIRDRLAASKGINKTFQRDLYRVRQACQVDDEPPRTADDADLCIIEARTRRRRQELTRRWNDAVGRIDGPPLSPGTGQPEYLLSAHVDALKAALSWEDSEWRALRDRLQLAGVRAPVIPASAELAALANTMRVAALHVREKEIAAWLDAVAKRLADGAAQPHASPLWEALHREFTSHAWDQWGRMVDEVRRVSRLAEEVARCDGLSTRLAVAAPVWAGRIASSAGQETTTGPVASALRAWEWRQAATWLTAIILADDPGELQRKLESALQATARTTAELAAQSAWLAVAERLTDRERRGLTAWLDALRRIGKGTGKYAARWRNEAQKAMTDAQTAVPVWIMPAHRVVESFGPMARFDVVIMDESSQCDIFGLAALALADKAIIVGDDKQISPQAIGTEESSVHELIVQYIPDLPQSSLLDLKTSLYDLAKMRFPGVIMLREHFRCLPEIIEFSNRLSYNGAILPLREQPADPSWRSVIDVHIPNGFREPGTDTNIEEAEFIVDKIAALCDDPAYNGKTFGVISLLGEGQAELIERKLVARLGEKEMERRRIRCGNAYHFQGDERSVMFLSLVVAAGEGRRIGAMTKESDRQRLNVAASRAQDQLWCVRSVSLDELHPDDVRSQLIRYCQNPERVNQAEEEARFDSDFERDVFRHITGRGYRVRTQYRVGRYRIDLVIEGTRGRLAVELDGDAYHGPERWESDRQRQAILERLGWTFYRIRGSAYYRDPDTALTGLWERLESMGIRPVND
jgi:very-short-patch-repair endonuclease